MSRSSALIYSLTHSLTCYRALWNWLRCYSTISTVNRATTSDQQRDLSVNTKSSHSSRWNWEVCFQGNEFTTCKKSFLAKFGILSLVDNIFYCSFSFTAFFVFFFFVFLFSWLYTCICICLCLCFAVCSDMFFNHYRSFSVNLYVSRSVCLFFCLFICLSDCLSVCLLVGLFVCESLKFVLRLIRYFPI